MSDQYLSSSGLQAVASYESGTPGVLGTGNSTATTSGSTASGLYGIIDSTWQEFAGAAGVNTALYPTASSAPASVQTAVASTIPVSNWTCAGCDSGFTSALSSNPSWLSGGTAVADDSSDTTDDSGDISGSADDPNLASDLESLYASPGGTSTGTSAATQAQTAVAAQNNASGTTGTAGAAVSSYLSSFESWVSGWAEDAGLVAIGALVLIAGIIILGMHAMHDNGVSVAV